MFFGETGDFIKKGEDGRGFVICGVKRIPPSIPVVLMGFEKDESKPLIFDWPVVFELSEW